MMCQPKKPNIPSQLTLELESFETYLDDAYPGGSFVADLARDMILSGGKRLRPALTIAAAMTGNYKQENVFPVAAAVESLHTATLAHDDVIDCAQTRRNQKTVFAEHGSHIAVYVGDYLLARSLKILSKCDLPVQELSKMADAVEQICVGDIAQYMGRSKIPGHRAYLKRILGKTGILFAAASSTGGFAGQTDESVQKNLWHFGMRFGAAFQIRDDLLDLDEADENAGKPIGRDLLDGIVTLPILLMAAQADFRLMLERYLDGSRSEKDAKELVELARKNGSVQQSKRILNKYLDRCHSILAQLPESCGRDYLAEMTELLRLKES